MELRHMPSEPITRRHCLAAGLATIAIAPGALAAVPPASTQGPGVYRSKLGNFQITALYDGIWPVKIEDHFVRNASNAEVDAALAAAFLPPGILPVSFTALLINTGSKLVLIDTGTAGQITDSAGTLLDNLAVAGVQPGQIDIILISHFHPDHINGIKDKDGNKIFSNAEIAVPDAEWSFWMNGANMSGVSKTVHRYFLNARRIFADIAGEVRRFAPGAEVAPGIVAIAAPGHTPGHVAFSVSSGNESMLVLSDSARNPYLFVRHPDWQPSFDMDGPLAVQTRRRLLDQASADRMLVHGYHFPFPATGHIAKSPGGYELVPTLWRPL
jgi:glyoxylase-like metal-dependent hydrolase (beta-lactamase superfamily II)